MCEQYILAWHVCIAHMPAQLRNTYYMTLRSYNLLCSVNSSHHKTDTLTEMDTYTSTETEAETDVVTQIYILGHITTNNKDTLSQDGGR